MINYGKFTDEELLKLQKGGRENVTDYLLDKYKPMVKKKARVLYLMGGEQDDLIQEGMIGLFKAIRDYCPEKDTSFSTFAQLCVDRQLYNAVQSSNRQKHRPLNTYVPLNTEEGEHELRNFRQQSPENIVIARENEAAMEQKIREQLSDFENQVLECYLKGENYLQIAGHLGRPPKSVDNALQRIRSKVRAWLEQTKSET